MILSNLITWLLTGLAGPWKKDLQKRQRASENSIYYSEAELFSQSWCWTNPSTELKGDVLPAMFKKKLKCWYPGLLLPLKTLVPQWGIYPVCPGQINIWELLPTTMKYPSFISSIQQFQRNIMLFLSSYFHIYFPVLSNSCSTARE